MNICTTISSLRKVLDQTKTTIHFIPTMGALHDGHLELIRKARENKGVVVCSIFVNPTQFHETADLEKYPRTTATDIKMLRDVSCDFLFLPDVMEIYPEHLESIPYFDTNGIEDRWEGQFRPGHFKGMLQVVHRLLDIVKPQHLYMGQKDYQQQLLVKYMLNNIFPGIQLITVPTVREYNGLAMSSRNARLSSQGKEVATHIYKNLVSLANSLKSDNDLEVNIQHVKNNLTAIGFKVEYLALVNPDNMEEIVDIKYAKEAVIIIAAWLEGIRLIDNIIITTE